MIETKIKPALAAMTFQVVDAFTGAYNRFDLPVLSTGRSFGYYRRIFFDNRSENSVLDELEGKRILDIGCGLTPYVSNSMFQACHKAGIEFYGIDPKLAEGFKLGPFDRMKIMASGGNRMNPNAQGMEKGIGTLADDLPFEDNSVDLILSCYVIFAWISDEKILNNIFREFQRVLKPSGKVRIFPSPHYDPNSIRLGELTETMKLFDVQQEFLSPVLKRTQFGPAYLRTMVKI